MPGASVTFTATIAPAPTGGTVQFFADGATLGVPVTVSSGSAATSTSALSIGTHPITATYSGDANYYGSASNVVNQVVNDPTPTISSIGPTSAAVNAPDFTLTVTGTNFIAGSVVRWNGNDRVTMFVSSTKLTATILKNDLSAAGTANITVFNPGLSNTAVFTINPTASTISIIVTSSCNPCMVYQTSRITATVTNTVGSLLSAPVKRPRDAVPSGTLTFKDNGNNITGCVNIGLNGQGQGVCATILPGGTHLITAQYSGDANFNSASGTLLQRVDYLHLFPSIQKH
jgi:large repetitive protein